MDRADTAQKSVSLSADGPLEKYVPQILAVFPTIAVAAASGGLPVMFGIAEVQEYARGRKQGLSPGAALGRAIPMAAAEVIGEKLGGTGKLLQALEKVAAKGATIEALKEFSGRLAVGGLREIPAEELTYAMQFGIDKTPGIGLNPEASLADFVEGAKDTAIVAGGAGALMTGGRMALSRAARAALQAGRNSTDQVQAYWDAPNGQVLQAAKVAPAPAPATPAQVPAGPIGPIGPIGPLARAAKLNPTSPPAAPASRSPSLPPGPPAGAVLPNETQPQAPASTNASTNANASAQTPDMQGMQYMQDSTSHAPVPMGLAQPGDIQNSKGEPFKERFAAMRVQRAAGPGVAEVIPVQGGFVVRRRAAPDQLPAMGALPTTQGLPRPARAQSEQEAAAHQLMQTHGQAALGWSNWDKLHGIVGNWALAPAGSMERLVYEQAAKRAGETGAQQSSQQLFPYALQIAQERGVQPNAFAPVGTIPRWLANSKLALRESWGKVTGKPETVKAQDLVNLAFGMAQMQNPARATGQGEKQGRNTNSSVRAALIRRFGRLIAVLEASGLLRIWDSVEQFNSQTGQQIQGSAQGMWDGRTAHLFASSIPKGKEVGVVLHEVGEHASMPEMLGPENYQRLLERALALLQAGDPTALEALGRIPQDTPAKDRPSELLAYLIEAGSARAEQASPGVRKWLADTIAAIRAWWSTTGLNAQLARHGLGIELTAQDIVALADRAVRWQGGQQVARGSIDTTTATGVQETVPSVKKGLPRADDEVGTSGLRWWGGVAAEASPYDLDEQSYGREPGVKLSLPEGVTEKGAVKSYEIVKFNKKDILKHKIIWFARIIILIYFGCKCSDRKISA